MQKKQRNYLLVAGAALVILLLVAGRPSKLSVVAAAAPWSPTASQLAQGVYTCFPNSGYVYCVGYPFSGSYSVGFTDFGQISGGAVSSWNVGPSYPGATGLPSCAAASGYVYCIGAGETAAYSSALSDSGFGAWSVPQEGPLVTAANIGGSWCGISYAIMYCVIGDIQTVNPPAREFFSVPVLNGVFGTWTQGHALPGPAATNFACSILAGYLYCVGGSASAVGYVNAYRSPLSANSSNGSWSSITSYPVTVSAASCNAFQSTLFCVGGANASGQPTDGVYSYSGGLAGNWTDVSAQTYPLDLDFLGTQSCVTDGQTWVTCIGGRTFTAPSTFGFTSSVYTIFLGAASTTTTSTMTTSSTTTNNIPMNAIAPSFSVLVVIVGVVVAIVASGYALTIRKKDYTVQ